MFSNRVLENWENRVECVKRFEWKFVVDSSLGLKENDLVRWVDRY